MDQAQTPWLMLPLSAGAPFSLKSKEARDPMAAPPRIIFLKESRLPELKVMLYGG
jgi:hypothetical protein